MDKFDVCDLDIHVAPTGTSDAVGGLLCGGVFIVLLFVPRFEGE